MDFEELSAMKKVLDTPTTTRRKKTKSGSSEDNANSGYSTLNPRRKLTTAHGNTLANDEFYRGNNVYSTARRNAIKKRAKTGVVEASAVAQAAQYKSGRSLSTPVGPGAGQLNLVPRSLPNIEIAEGKNGGLLLSECWGTSKKRRHGFLPDICLRFHFE